MKRPSENTAEGNAKKCKSFHPEPSTSGIHLNATTPVVQSKGSGRGIIGYGSGRCRGSKWGRSNRGRGRGKGYG